MLIYNYKLVHWHWRKQPNFFPVYNISIKQIFLSILSINLRSIVSRTVVTLNPCIVVSRPANHMIFFLVIIITVRIQHYSLYSDSPNLLPIMMSRPPAPPVLWLLCSYQTENSYCVDIGCLELWKSIKYQTDKEIKNIEIFVVEKVKNWLTWKTEQM